MSFGRLEPSLTRRFLVLGHVQLEQGAQSRQSSFGVSQQGQIQVKVLGHLVRVQVNVNQPGVRVKRPLERGKDLGKNVSTTNQHHVRVLHDVSADLAKHVSGGSAVQRVRGAEVDLARVDPVNGCAQGFGQGFQLEVSARKTDAIAHQNQRTLCHCQPRSSFLQTFARGNRSGVYKGARAHFTLEWRVQYVHRKGHKHRAAGRGLSHFDGAAQHP